MRKKSLKDYTPEELWKLERRLMTHAIKHNPEAKLHFEKFIEDISGIAKARNEALRFKSASEEMGRTAFTQWCKDNPLSARAQLHLGMIEREIAAPSIEHGKKFTQRKKGAQAEHTKEIYKLAKQHPNKSAKELQAMATNPKAKKLSPGRFATVVSQARNADQ